METVSQEARNRAALDQIDRTIRSMALRPGMYGGGDALAVECQARLALRLRRTLLGAEPDDRRRSLADYFDSVYGRLILDWFGVVNVGASAFMKDEKIGQFVAELYHRERQKVHDPEGSTEDIQGRVLFWTEFVRLRNEWRIATLRLSDVRKKTGHPSYRAVVALGWPVVRPILGSFVGNADPEPWGPALCEITGENPAPRRTVMTAANLRKIAKDWLAWGEERGFSFR